MWYINPDKSFYRFVTIHACDRRTDGRTNRQTDRILITIPCLHYMQRGKNYSIQCSSQSELYTAHTLLISRPNQQRWWTIWTEIPLLTANCKGFSYFTASVVWLNLRVPARCREAYLPRSDCLLPKDILRNILPH